MNPEIKARWLAALRSGEYIQGVEALKKKVADETGDEQVKFCCLGVLCDLHSKEIGEKWEEGKPFSLRNSSYLGHDDYLPVVVMAWAGLGETDPGFNDSESVANMNDNGYTFAEIADEIEKAL